MNMAKRIIGLNFVKLGSLGNLGQYVSPRNAVALVSHRKPYVSRLKSVPMETILQLIFPNTLIKTTRTTVQKTVNNEIMRFNELISVILASQELEK
jgi:hypothetical protein